MHRLPFKTALGLFSFLLSAMVLSAQEPLTITATIKGISASDTLILASSFADQQYLADSARRGAASDEYVFEIPDSIRKAGLYSLLIQPKGEYYQILIDRDQPDFSFAVDRSDWAGTVEFTNSEQNTGFYEYLRFLQKHRKKQEALLEKMKSDSPAAKNAKLAELTSQVRAYQDQLIGKYPGTLLALTLANARNLIFPDFEGTEEEVQKRRYQYFRSHYFDLMDLDDDRNMNIPGFSQKIDDYVHKYTVAHPDSVFAAIDEVLQSLSSNELAYKYFLSTYLNKYVQSPLMGMDKVYVQLVDHYYAKGKAPWIDPESLSKIIDAANFYRHIVIGEPTPPLLVSERSGKTYSIFDHQAEVTVLVFWSPTCSHCKKELPEVAKIYDDYQDKGVSLITLCTKDDESCWEFLDSAHLGDSWISAKPASNCYRTYDLRTTPKIYVLDSEKNVQFKNIGASNLKEVLDILLADQKK